MSKMCRALLQGLRDISDGVLLVLFEVDSASKSPWDRNFAICIVGQGPAHAHVVRWLTFGASNQLWYPTHSIADGI